MTKNSKIVIGGIAVLGVALAIFFLAQPDKDDHAVKTPVTANVPVDNPSATNKANRYKDGTYSATGNYDAPSGKESIGVSLVLKDNVITDVTITPTSENRVSSRYQQGFATNVKAYVVGKSIDSVNLDVVSGSSLTPQGFNDALAQIKAQARI